MSRSGKCSAPNGMGLVSYSAPINRTEDNRLTHAEEHDTQSAERIIDNPNRFNPTAAKGMPRGWGYITGKCCKMK
jgi:hypothetical protein